MMYLIKRILYLRTVGWNLIPNCKIQCEKEIKTKYRSTIKECICYIEFIFLMWDSRTMHELCYSHFWAQTLQKFF